MAYAPATTATRQAQSATVRGRLPGPTAHRARGPLGARPARGEDHAGRDAGDGVEGDVAHQEDERGGPRQPGGGAADPVEQRPQGGAHQGEERQQEQVQPEEGARALELVDELVDDHEGHEGQRRPEQQEASGEFGRHRCASFRGRSGL
jgi:hypothetical protein